MNFVYTFNNNFCAQTATSICSICENNKKINNITFYLIIHELTRENKNKIEKLIKSYNRKVFFLELTNISDYIEFEFDTTGWPSITLARLLMGQILPSDIERIIYIDGDTIVRDDLTDLWNFNLENRIIAMSMEPTINKDRIKILNLGKHPYCNAGVILVDLKKWRETNACKKIFDYYKKHNGKLFASDQDAINGALKNDIKILTPNYNFYNIYTQYPYSFINKRMKKYNYFDKKTYIECKNNPKIIHFLGEERPWRKGNNHKYRKEFDYYLKLTPYDNFEYEKGWELYFICWNVFNILTKPFPSIRLKIINSLIPSFLKFRNKKINKEEKNNIHTFVVLAYKESKYLEDCIKSLFNQTIKTNIIIATSTQNKYIEKLAKKYNLEIIVNKKGKGIGADFDFALNCVNSELVTIAHQDDIYESRYAEEILKAYHKTKNPIIFFTDYYEIKEFGKQYKNVNLNIKKILLFPLRIRFWSGRRFFKRHVLRFGNGICCPSVTFKKSLCPEKVFTCDMKCNVDWYAWEKLSNLPGKFIYINKYLMGHRIHEESTTTDIINNNIRTLEDLKLFKKFWPDFIAKRIAKLYQLSEKNNQKNS